jgi:hypothetical protein
MRKVQVGEYTVTVFHLDYLSMKIQAPRASETSGIIHQVIMSEASQKTWQQMRSDFILKWSEVELRWISWRQT